MQFNTRFPIGIQANWARPEQLPVPDPCLKNWLLDTSSLTERLQSQCRQLELTLFGQEKMQPTDAELNRLQHDDQCEELEWQIREVLLSAEQVPWVFARSVLPNALCQSDLAELGNKPLGKILFNDQRFERQPFEIARIDAPNKLYQQFSLNEAKRLWARRSIFTYKHYKMMVTEVFLPNSPAFKLIYKDNRC